ncbi:non-hydrolyzing UDP-N-acetylglucosamine 2-epimerase [Haladaptatus salinisoli]|uniref:non-hydrolyzing UDP-N-acetylglucosamine 2-epimerase n=1 Tax=Haladaptatus salinisoli TaxID=2884876 RepID=UPI001D0AF04C|nr:UDP-N-acetylglucosamine 2-epimerase (non-hydrolyzing) [Haladaptatus salinisoli]
MDNSKIVTEPVPDKTCVIVGTRPGIIKMSPIIAALNDRDIESFTIHAGQHYSYELDGRMFEDLQLDEPKYRIEGIEETEYHGEQTAAMLEGIEAVLLEERPQTVLVCGDANFNLAGALAARKLRLDLGHVEAGLRSGDWRMPEEHNRVMIDHISDYLFAPTEQTRANAVEDNVKGEIVVTGNTIVDAVERNMEIARERSDILERLSLGGKEYAVFTAHREENVDDRAVLSDLVEILDRVTSEVGIPAVYPLHPRTEKRLEQFGLMERIREIADLHLIDPVGYLDFLQLLANADVTLTDSGGIQEESCIIGVPCVTLRENTERPETVEVGANTIAGTDPDAVIRRVEEARGRTGDWENPFGDGDAAHRIADTVLDEGR